MRAVAKQLRVVLARVNPVCGAILFANGNILAQDGDFDVFPARMLVGNLIGTRAKAKQVYDALRMGDSDHLVFREGLAIALVKELPSGGMAVVFDLVMAGRDHEFWRCKVLLAAIGQCFDPTTNRETSEELMADVPVETALISIMPDTEDSLPLDLGDIVLRRVVFPDREDLHEIYSNSEVVRWWHGAPNDEGRIARYAFAQTRVHLGHPLTPFGLAVELKAESKVIGDCRLVIETMNNLAEIGFAFHPGYWGRGFATKAVQAAVDFVFRERDVHRIGAGTYSHNERARRLLERIGMKQEGHFRQVRLVGDERLDIVMYAILRDDRS